MAFDVHAITTETLDIVKQITPIEPKRKRKKITHLTEYNPQPSYPKRCTIDLFIGDPLMITASLKEKLRPVYILECDMNNSNPTNQSVWGNYPEVWRRTDLSAIIQDDWFPLNGVSFVRCPKLRILRAPNTYRYQWFKKPYEIDVMMMAFKKDPPHQLDPDTKFHIYEKIKTLIKGVKKNGYDTIVFSKLGYDSGYPPEEMVPIIKSVLIEFAQMILSVYFCFEPNDPSIGLYQQILYS